MAKATRKLTHIGVVNACCIFGNRVANFVEDCSARNSSEMTLGSCKNFLFGFFTLALDLAAHLASPN